MKDLEAFPHNALVLQKTCICCGKTIYWERSWRVQWSMDKRGYLCRLCAKSKKEAEEWFRRNLQNRRPKTCPPEQVARSASPLVVHMSEQPTQNNECLTMIVRCRDCGKTVTFPIYAYDVCDWGWTIADDIDAHGFDVSDRHAYCKACARNHKRSPLGGLSDEAKNEI